MCRCSERDHYHGQEATEFAKKLTEITVDAREWKILYRCPACGTSWIKTYPHSEYHGGGPPELDRIKDDSTPAP